MERWRETASRRMFTTGTSRQKGTTGLTRYNERFFRKRVQLTPKLITYTRVEASNRLCTGPQSKSSTQPPSSTPNPTSNYISPTVNLTACSDCAAAASALVRSRSEQHYPVSARQSGPHSPGAPYIASGLTHRGIISVAAVRGGQ